MLEATPMNTQRYGLPVIIAASLHGALFLITVDPPISAAPLEKPTVIREVPLYPDSIEIPDATEESSATATGGPRPLPSTPDVPPIDDRSSDFTVPVETSFPPITIDRGPNKIPQLPFGPGDGTDEPVSGIPRNIVGHDQLDRVPRAVVRRTPIYPDGPRQAGLDGSVTVEFVVGTDGRVLHAEAVKWSHREFVEPAVRAVREWRFEPGTQGGRKVRFRMAVPIEFNAGE